MRVIYCWKIYDFLPFFPIQSSLTPSLHVFHLDLVDYESWSQSPCAARQWKLHDPTIISSDAFFFFSYAYLLQPLDVELHDAQSRTYGLKAQVGVIGGVLPGFVTGIHKDSVRRWNLWFHSAGVFAKVLAGRATGTQITSPPPMR